MAIYKTRIVFYFTYDDATKNLMITQEILPMAEPGGMAFKRMNPIKQWLISFAVQKRAEMFQFLQALCSAPAAQSDQNAIAGDKAE